MQNHKNIMSAVPVYFSLKRSNETKINGPMTCQIIMLCCVFFLSRIELYTRLGPVLNYPKTVDYILERNLMKCQPTKTDVFTLICKICVQMQSYLSRMSEISIHN